MSDDTLTELDEALRIARERPETGNFFYDAFLNTPVFFPALRADKKPGEWARLSATERFFPLYLHHGETRAIPVFDRLEKMKNWAGDKAFDYQLLQASVLLKVIAPEIAIVLNEGTAHRYLFPPDILERLRFAMRPVQPQ